MLKKIIKKMTTPEQRVKINRVLGKMMSFKHKENYYRPYKEIVDKDSDVFFGYYDINQFSGNNIAFLKVKNDKCKIFVRKNDGGELYIDSTNAWCWQQGCRLRWHPSKENTLMWNDFDGYKYYTRTKNIYTGNEEIIEYPFYDVSKNGYYGLAIDFGRLGYMRPGYGYTNLPNRDEDAYGGIVLVNMNTFIVESFVSYNDILSLIPQKLDPKICYLNHLLFNPSGNKFLFFFLTKERIHKARLFVYDIDKSELKLLENEYSVSHYCWINDDEIIATAYDENRECKYYLYKKDACRKILMPDKLTVDGHPTIISKDIMITDTYPNNEGFQKVLKVDFNENNIDVIADLYSTAKYLGERRTDLHPRVDLENKRVAVDSNVNGRRKVCILERCF